MFEYTQINQIGEAIKLLKNSNGSKDSINKAKDIVWKAYNSYEALAKDNYVVDRMKSVMLKSQIIGGEIHHVEHEIESNPRWKLKFIGMHTGVLREIETSIGRIRKELGAVAELLTEIKERANSDSSYRRGKSRKPWKQREYKKPGNLTQNKKFFSYFKN